MRNLCESTMIAPLSSFSPALSGIAGARGLTTLRMSEAELRPWDVKQEGGQMESGWGTGEDPSSIDSNLLFERLQLYVLSLHRFRRSGVSPTLR